MRSAALLVLYGSIAIADPSKVCDRSAARQRQHVFARIAVNRDYTDEWVVYRDADVTAFLDIGDRCHPKRNVACAAGPAHVLVVPNAPREHIGKTFESEIGPDDLAVATKVMQKAEMIGTRLHLEHARVYINAPENVEIGYLHVHLVGERTTPYPAPMK